MGEGITRNAQEKAHFGNIRGIDKYKGLEVVIVLGRLQPSPSAVERIAKGLVYDRDDSLQLLGEENYPEIERGYRLANGSEFGVRVPCHTEEEDEAPISPPA